MVKYKGRSKCPCGARASYRSKDGWQHFYACEKHKEKIAHIEDSEKDEDRMTEADHQTWEGL